MACRGSLRVSQVRDAEQTREAVDSYIGAEFLFSGRRGRDRSITTRQYARLVCQFIASIGLDPSCFGTHSLHRTKATLIYRRTGNLRSVRLLLGTRRLRTRCVSQDRGRRRPRHSRANRCLNYRGRAEQFCPSRKIRAVPAPDLPPDAENVRTTTFGSGYADKIAVMIKQAPPQRPGPHSPDDLQKALAMALEMLVNMSGIALRLLR
jgi:hypothetical protein